jgi:hypothetical protein
LAIQQYIHDAAFDADVVKILVEAYDGVRLALNLPSGDSDVNHQIADRIMRMAKDGERDPQVICKRVLMQMEQR